VKPFTAPFRPLLASLERREAKPLPEDLLPLRENIYLLTGRTAKKPAEPSTLLTNFRRFDQRWHDHSKNSRIGRRYLTASGYQFSQASFTSYIQAFPASPPVLKMAELWMLIPVMKLALLERIAELGRRSLENPSGPYPVDHAVRCLQDIQQVPWKVTIEPLILFDPRSARRPCGSYARMDYEIASFYRQKLVIIADRSDCSEIRLPAKRSPWPVRHRGKRMKIRV